MIKNKIKILLTSLFIITLFNISNLSALSNIDNTFMRWWWDNIWWIEFKWTNFWIEITNDKVNWEIWSPNYWEILLQWTNYSVINTVEKVWLNCVWNLSWYAWWSNLWAINFANASIDANWNFSWYLEWSNKAWKIYLSWTNFWVKTTWTPDCTDTDWDWILDIYEDEIRADVDDSWVVSSSDAMLILQKSVWIDISSSPWVVTPETGDVTCDNLVTSSDAMLTLQYSVWIDVSSTSWCDTKFQ